MTVLARPYALRSFDTDWDYAQWETLPADGNRYEVIDGVLYVTTAPSNFHQWIIMQLIETVGFAAKQSGLGYYFFSPIGVLMPGCDPVQPDFLLVRHSNAGIIADRRIRGVPDLIVEVLSPTNPEQDTQIKRSAYARAGLAEYWIVRPATRDVLVCWQPDAALADFAQTTLLPADATLRSPTLEGVTLAVAALFDGAPDTTL